MVPLRAATARADEAEADALSDSLECVSLDAPAVVDMPLELLDLIVLAGGWRGWFTWRAVSRRWSELPKPFRRHVCVVPDDQETIVRGISNAPANEGCGGPLVLVRPGTYAESVRVLRDVTLVGLGEVVVRAPGWESALVWGGYTVRGVKLFDQFELQSSNAGAGARVHNLTLCQRNQSQATAVYCTWGTPLLTHCRIGAGCGSLGGHRGRRRPFLPISASRRQVKLLRRLLRRLRTGVCPQLRCLPWRPRRWLCGLERHPLGRFLHPLRWYLLPFLYRCCRSRNPRRRRLSSSACRQTTTRTLSSRLPTSLSAKHNRASGSLDHRRQGFRSPANQSTFCRRLKLGTPERHRCWQVRTPMTTSKALRLPLSSATE